MAFNDASLVFSTAQAITTTADSTNVIDVTGAGSGNAPAMIGANGLNTAIGVDYADFDGSAGTWLYMIVTTTGTTANTLTVSLNAAPDNGSYSPGTYTAIYTSKAFAGTALIKGNVLQVPIPPILNTFGEALPRFYKVIYTCSGALTVSVTTELLINPPSVGALGLYGSNFTAV